MLGGASKHTVHVNRDETSLLSTTVSDDDEDVGADDGAGDGDGVGGAGLDGLQGNDADAGAMGRDRT